MLTKTKFQQMNESDLCKVVLIPLLRAMKYKDVFEYHGGAGEQGKDIVCWSEDNAGFRRNLAIVAKAVPLNGKAKGMAAEVSTQLNQALGTTFNDPVTGISRRVQECWVVTNKTIKKEAQSAILAATNESYRSHVYFIDGDKLWQLVEQYLQLKFQQTMLSLFEASRNLDEHFYPHMTFTNEGIYISVQEKTQGAFKDKSFKVKTEFIFPKDSEGESLRKALEAHIESGIEVEVPGRYIRRMEIPSFLNEVVGIVNWEEYSLYLSTVPSKEPIRLQIFMECDDGDLFKLEHVELKVRHSGTKVMSLDNTDQHLPFDVQIKLNLDHKTSTFTMKPRNMVLNALQYRILLHYLVCLSKSATLNVRYQDTNISVFRYRNIQESFESPDAELIALFEDIAKIQEKTRTPIYIPDRDFTLEELDSIARLRTILHFGIVEGTWSEFVITVTELSDVLKDAFNNEQGLSVRLQQSFSEDLFGITIPMGPVIHTVKNAQIANKEEIINNLSKSSPIEVRLIPGNDNVIRSTYTNWELTAEITSGNMQVDYSA